MDQNPYRPPQAELLQVGSGVSTVNTFVLRAAQKDIIRVLSSKMRFVSVVLLFLGVLVFGLALVSIAGLAEVPVDKIVDGLIGAALNIAIGIWLFRGARAFKTAWSNTDGTVEQLFEGIERIKDVFVLLFWTFIVAFALIGTGVAIGLAGSVAGG